MQFMPFFPFKNSWIFVPKWILESAIASLANFQYYFGNKRSKTRYFWVIFKHCVVCTKFILTSWLWVQWSDFDFWKKIYVQKWFLADELQWIWVVWFWLVYPHRRYLELMRNQIPPPPARNRFHYPTTDQFVRVTNASKHSTVDTTILKDVGERSR